MKCEACSERLSGYIDGMLEPRDLLQVEQHLRRCGLCAAELEQLRAAIAMLSAVEEMPVPASFRASLHNRLLEAAAELPKAGKVRKIPTRGIFRWAVPAATAAAAAAIVVGLWQNQPVGQPTNPGTQPPNSSLVATVPPLTPGDSTLTDPNSTPLAPPVTPDQSGQQDPNTGGSGGKSQAPATGTSESPKATENGQNSSNPIQPPVRPPVPNQTNNPGSVAIASLPVEPQPEGTYKQTHATASYRGMDAAQLKVVATKYHAEITEQGQPVDGGVQYLLSVPKSKLANFFTDLDHAYTPIKQSNPTDVDVTAQVNQAIRQFAEARKSNVQQDIEDTGAYLQREMNLQNWAEVQITLSK